MDWGKGGPEWKPRVELFSKHKPDWLKTEGAEQRREMVGFYEAEKDAGVTGEAHTGHTIK